MFQRRTLAIIATGAIVAVACGGTAPATSSAAPATAAAVPTATVEPFDEAKLLAAAKSEPPLVALNNSGIVTTIAQLFEQKYGLKVNGTKADTPTQVQQVTREVQSGNVKLGVLSIEDGATVQQQLIAQGFVENYVPGDMVKSVPKEWQNPLVQYWDANVITYNSELSSCPVNNVWDLTDAAWKGRVAIKDPLNTPQLISWFSFLVNEPVAGNLAKAYQTKYGSALQTTEKNAGYEFIKRLAANKPIIGKSDDDAAAAVGAPGQKNAPVGMMSLGKHGEAPGKGNKLGVCKGIQPFLGFAYPRYAVIVKGTPSPNAARLYVHFLMSVDGVAPSMDDHGGFSANTDVRAGKVEFVGARDYWQQNLTFLDPAFNARAWEAREPLSDFWRLNLK
jgi:iron(III) transport system substrate-binding protein